MMLTNRFKSILHPLLILGFILSGCAPGATSTPPTPTATPAPWDALPLIPIEFSKPQAVNVEGFPDGLVVYQSYGKYSERGSSITPIQVVITASGGSEAALLDYTNNTLFAFDIAPASAFVSAKSAETQTPEATEGSPTDFSLAQALKNDSAIWIQFEPEIYVLEKYPNYALWFSVDPTITRPSGIHNYSNSVRGTSAYATIQVTSGTAAATIFYKKINITGCRTYANNPSIPQPSRSTLSDGVFTYTTSFDLIVTGTVVPLTYSVTGAWSNLSPKTTSGGPSCP